MNKITAAALTALFAANLAFAQSPAEATNAAEPSASMGDSNCAAKAVSSSGKPLTGAAKASFMKKCEASMDCAARAMDKNGKPLAGAAKSSFMKKCEAAAGKKK